MFSAEWLALRERFDASARSASLVELLCRSARHGAVVRAVDLAAGTGANVRYLAARLPAGQDWLLVDADAELLALAPRRMSEWAGQSGGRTSSDDHGMLVTGGGRPDVRVVTRRLDLASLHDADLFARRDLVTASALLDLVSEMWMREAAARCREAGAAVLFALTYDGRIECSPPDPEDAAIRALVNRHQRIDKGFGGPALGPGAAAAAERCFAEVGYQVRRERSDWYLPPDAGKLQRQLIGGWMQAAMSLAPDEAARIRSWCDRRLAHVEAGRSTIAVGHEDLVALPADEQGARGAPARERRGAWGPRKGPSRRLRQGFGEPRRSSKSGHGGCGAEPHVIK